MSRVNPPSPPWSRLARRGSAAALIHPGLDQSVIKRKPPSEGIAMVSPETIAQVQEQGRKLAPEHLEQLREILRLRLTKGSRTIATTSRWKLWREQNWRPARRSLPMAPQNLHLQHGPQNASSRQPWDYSDGYDAVAENALAVCLVRMGRKDEALRLLPFQHCGSQGRSLPAPLAEPVNLMRFLPVRSPILRFGS